MNDSNATSAESRKDNPLRTSIRRLSAIMFTDLVGYSALVQRDEPLAMQLLDAHRRMVRAALPGFGGREVETAGDAFLIEFASALEAVRCAIVIQKNHAAYNENCVGERQVRTRIGIHLGDVEHRGKSVFGDGVNIAARIEPHAPPGGIALSAPLHTQVAQTFKDAFCSLGPTALKNIAAAVEIFVLDAAAIGALPAPEPRKSGLRQRLIGLRLAVSAGIAVAGLLLAVLARPLLDSPPADKSVAVLPFANFSADPRNQYFTDGLHDSVLTHLAYIRDLKVISRTSVQSYLKSSKPLRDIARELNVAHIVEGSVQRDGNRLRVIVQLINAATDEHLWAANYDRELKDVFAVQAEVAQGIASAVHAQITAPEKARMERPPTQDLEAYGLYLQALEVAHRGIPDEAKWQGAIAKLDQAVAMDPRFAVAFTVLANLHINGYLYGYGAPSERLRNAQSARESARRLDPGHPEVVLMQAKYMHDFEEDFAGIPKLLEPLLIVAPGVADVHYRLGKAYVRLSRWQEALDRLAMAYRLDPRNYWLILHYGNLLAQLNRFEEADTVLRQVEPVTDDKELERYKRTKAIFPMHRSLDELEARFAEVPQGPNQGCGSTAEQWQIHIWRRRYVEAARAFDSCVEAGVRYSDTSTIPKELFVAFAFDFAGDSARALLNYQAARAGLETQLERHPDEPLLRSHYAFALAGTGERQRGLDEARQAIEGMALSKDSFKSGDVLELTARFYAHVGEKDLALEKLEVCLRTPYCAKAAYARMDPFFDSLRGHSRFEKLIAENTALLQKIK